MTMAFLNANIAFIIAIILYGLIHFFNRWIHRYNGWIFIVSLILAFLTIFIDIPFIGSMIDSGHVALVLFLLVMTAGILAKKSTAYKKLLLVRGDLAILGFIFLVPHGIVRLSLALYGYNPTGLFATIIMLPLVLSSFMIIRKKIRPDRWKKLHQFAYLAYLLIYIHLGFDISINSTNVYLLISPFSLIFHLYFILYITLKVLRIIEKKKGLMPSQKG